MASIAPELKSKLQRNPNATVHLIVRLKDAPKTFLDKVTARGLTIRHTYSLISAIAIEGKASESLALAKEKWVLSLEEDKTVHTMGSK